MIKKTLLLLFACLALVHAQEQNQLTTTQEPDSSVQNQVQDGSIKLFLDKIQIQGKLEKPQAVFFIPGQSPEIDDIRLERSFFKDIFRPVERTGRIIPTPMADEKRRRDFIPW